MSKQIKTLPKTQPQRNHISHSLLRLLVSYNPAQEEGSATKKASSSSPWNPVSSTHSSCFFVFGSALTPVYVMLIHWFKIRLYETRQNLLLQFEIRLSQFRLRQRLVAFLAGLQQWDLSAPFVITFLRSANPFCHLGTDALGCTCPLLSPHTLPPSQRTQELFFLQATKSLPFPIKQKKNKKKKHKPFEI